MYNSGMNKSGGVNVQGGRPPRRDDTRGYRDYDDGYRNDGYRNDGYRNDGYRNDGYRNDGYRNDRVRDDRDY